METISKAVSDLQVGDYVDLASCPYLKGHTSAQFEYAQVAHVEKETPTCRVIGYDGIDHIGYPVGTILQVHPAEKTAAGMTFAAAMRNISLVEKKWNNFFGQTPARWVFEDLLRPPVIHGEIDVAKLTHLQEVVDSLRIGREPDPELLISGYTGEAEEQPAEVLREWARDHMNDCHCQGEPGFCDPSQASWSVEVVPAELFRGDFANAQAARAWLDEEIQMAEQDELPRDWKSLLTEPIRDEVFCLVCGNEAYIWDGYHRIAALIATGRPIRAIVGRPYVTEFDPIANPIV
jgi:hypothetical protein